MADNVAGKRRKINGRCYIGLGRKDMELWQYHGNLMGQIKWKDGSKGDGLQDIFVVACFVVYGIL